MLCLVSLTGQAWAGDAHIVSDSGPKDVVIATDNATSEQILRVLATRFGFSVDHAAEANASIRFSGRLQGSLDRILDRVLRHEGHIIVRSAENSAGIRQVILLAPHAPAVTVTAPSENTQKEMTTVTVAREEPTGHPVAGSPPTTASNPPPLVLTPTAAPPQPPIDPTLRQVEEIGRQIMNVDVSRSVDARLSPADGIGTVASSQATGNVDSAQELTQRAVANVQALVSSLRAVCLGSCPAH
jgi:hypothetical protein